MITEDTRNVLRRAQREYGKSNQITVAIEELCELGAVLAKYPRYPKHEKASDKIRTKVIEEMADVFICLEHIKLIFNVDDTELGKAMSTKLERLERWLDSGNGFYQTTIDRELRD